MLPEQPEPDQPRQSTQKQEVEYVGAPVEYADEAEVPETVGVLAKFLAGGIIAWGVLAAVLGFCGAACAICALLWFLTSG